MHEPSICTPAARLACLASASRLTRIALAVTALQTALPAAALIVTSGELSQAVPVNGVVIGGLAVGGFSTGSLEINGGSSFSSDALWMAGGSAQGNGSVRVSGAGSSAVVSATTTGNLDVGGWGSGRLSVLDGASFSYGGAATSVCGAACRVFVSNAAGSTGQLTVSGAGSSFATPGRIVVGNASVFTVATDGFDYGLPGASSTATAVVAAGARVAASGMTVGNAGGGNGRLGTETSSGTLTVDGPGSAITLTRAASVTGGTSLLDLANGRNTTALLNISNGGRVSLDGSSDATQASFMRLGLGGGTGTTSSATVNISGSGSRLEMNASGSSFSLGAGGDANGTMNVTGGGAVGGFGSFGLVYGTIGGNGGTGALTVSGQDAAGTSSSASFSGTNTANGGGSFLTIGQSSSTSPGGRGTLSVLGGGQLAIDTRNVVLGTPALLSGFYVGYGPAVEGVLTVSGTGSVNGAPSAFSVLGGTGLAPYAAIGREGGNGSALISAGGRLVLDSAHASDPLATSNTSGNSLLLEIGRNSLTTAVPTTGSVTVTGTGSLLSLGGLADNFLIVGRGNGASGALNITAGGRVAALDLQIGREAGGSGTLNMNGGVLALSGSFTSSGLQGRGAVFNVGHANASGTATIAAGSVVTVSSATGTVPAFTLGGSLNNPGGSGTLLLSGASTLDVIGSGAAVRIGHTANDADHPGLGVAVLSGNGTRLSASGGSSGVAGSIIIASGPFSSGSLVVGAGALLSSDGSIGVAYAGSPTTGSSTGGSGVLVVNGRASAPQIVVGAGGYLGGSGVIAGNLYNRGGTINPGNSPGTLRVDGGFDNSQGQIILEVQRQADGRYATDQLILGDSSAMVFGSGRIGFRFLDDTDPTAFLDSGQFALSTFFKAVDAAGQVIDLPGTALASFASVQFDAQAAAYTISNFSFDAVNGASFSATPVPQPPAAWLLACGMLMLGLRRLRR